MKKIILQANNIDKDNKDNKIEKSNKKDFKKDIENTIKKRITFTVPPEIHSEFKSKSAKNGLEMRDVLLEVVKDYCKNN
jgi:hypothetical protein